MNTDSLKISDENLGEIMYMTEGIISDNETVYVAIKGTFKEYLICTDSYVHIIKKGFMTGHTFGNGDFRMPYSNITNAEVDMHLLSGYFELSAGGLQNKQMSYWSTDKQTDPKKQPNAISIVSKEMADLFRAASNFIMERVRDAQTNNGSRSDGGTSAADEIKKYKELLDIGAITEEEYQTKKAQLLGL